MRFFTLIFILMVLTGCRVPQETGTEWLPPNLPPTVDPSDTLLASAQRNYDVYCAHCHGYSGEGQDALSAERTLSLGYKTVPRHDSEGHTWMHPDQLLFEMIKYGVQNPLHLYVMTEYGSRFDDDEIWAVIEYMKLFWTDEQREHQAQLTAQFAENLPDWELRHLDIYAEEPE